MRPGLVVLGLCALAAAWLGLPARALPGPFSAHMTMHMAVVAVAAPLLAFGVAGRALDPVRRWPRPFAIALASIAELILVWGWHTPALHHAARHSSVALVLEQGSFLVSGLWLWLSAVGGQRRERAGAGIAGLLLTSMHMTLLGALLALPPRPLYEHAPPAAGARAAAEGAPGGTVHRHGRGPSGAQGGTTALDDQHLGGAIMIVGGGVAYLCGGLWLALGLLRDPRIAIARGAASTVGVEPARRGP